MKKSIKVCTLTHHTVPNYGAILQAYALQKILDKLEINNEILNYRSERVERAYYRSFFKCKGIKEKIKFFLYYKSRKKYKKFDQFVNKNLKLSNIYLKEDLEKANKYYDLFISGSDQVWNLRIHQGDTTYMLDFVNDDEKKSSYAASFGYEFIPENFLDISKKLISRYKYLLVREKSGERIIKDMHISKKVKIVSDPTILLEKDDYSKFVNNDKEEEYILFYDLLGSIKLKQFTKRLAEEKKMVIKCINTSYKKEKDMENLFYAGPHEFLNLIAKAKYVVTSSYHGIIFSLIFNKCFFYGLNDKVLNNNSRIIDLAEYIGFSSQNVDQTDINFNINYEKINEKIEKFRNYSIDILKQMIEERSENCNENN